MRAYLVSNTHVGSNKEMSYFKVSNSLKVGLQIMFDILKLLERVRAARRAPATKTMGAGKCVIIVYNSREKCLCTL
jgi:hypothetical protein